MYFKVFDKNGKDITDLYMWVITSRGEIRCVDYGDLVSMKGVKAVIYFDDDIRAKTIISKEV